MENEIIIGIARISTPKQNIDRQVRNILSVYPNAKIIKITCSRIQSHRIWRIWTSNKISKRK